MCRREALLVSDVLYVGSNVLGGVSSSLHFRLQVINVCIVVRQRGADSILYVGVVNMAQWGGIDGCGQ